MKAQPAPEIVKSTVNSKADNSLCLGNSLVRVSHFVGVLRSLREINIDVQKRAELLQQSLKPHGALSVRWSCLRFLDFCTCDDGCSERRVPGKQAAVVEGWVGKPPFSGKIMSMCSRNVSFMEGIAGFASEWITCCTFINPGCGNGRVNTWLILSNHSQWKSDIPAGSEAAKNSKRATVLAGFTLCLASFWWAQLDTASWRTQQHLLQN